MPPLVRALHQLVAEQVKVHTHEPTDPAESGRYGHAVRIVIAGGHGQLAMRLEKLLAERCDSPVGTIRDPEQAEDLRALGADPIVCDLESAAVDEVASHLDGADAVVPSGGGGSRMGLTPRGWQGVFCNARSSTVDTRAGVGRRRAGDWQRWPEADPAASELAG